MKTKQADKKFIRKWVKALRSGKFKQVRGVLRSKLGDEGMRYCCLGVACKLKADSSKRDFYTLGTTSFAKGWLLPLKDQKTLASKNDTSGWSFKRIANYIENKYL